MAPRRRPAPLATFAELAAVGDERAVELVHGEIVDKAAPTMEHGSAQRALGGALGPFVRAPGGRSPGGWWIGTEVDVGYGPHDVFRHDLVGWRRERAAERPTGRPVRLRPDWVCEILSTNRRRDQVDKLDVLRDAGVPFYWLVDPSEKTLTVLRLDAAGSVVALAAAAGATVRAQPFDAVELRVSVLLGDEDADA